MALQAGVDRPAVAGEIFGRSARPPRALLPSRDDRGRGYRIRQHTELRQLSTPPRPPEPRVPPREASGHGDGVRLVSLVHLLEFNRRNWSDPYPALTMKSALQDAQTCRSEARRRAEAHI